MKDFVEVGFLDSDGNAFVNTMVDDLVKFNDEPYIVESIEDGFVTIINEENSYYIEDSSLEHTAFDINGNEKTGILVEGMMYLGESEIGSVYVDSNDKLYLNESKVEQYWPYIGKDGTVVLVGEVHNDVVETWDVDGAFKEIPISKFEKEFKRGTDKDLELFTEANDDQCETQGLELKKTAVNGKTLTLVINGKKYSYTPKNGMSAKEMAKKFSSIAKYSEGKALAWVKKNATTADSYKSSKD